MEEKKMTLEEAKKEQKKKLFLALFAILVMIGATYVYLTLRNEVDGALVYLQEMNWLYLLLLIPVIILMYYMAGGIWRPYMVRTGLSTGQLGMIQYELNFVNTVVPFFNILTGMVYAQRRMEKYNLNRTETATLYTFRYYISVATKWIEIAFAMLVLAISGRIGEMPTWTVWVVCLLSALILGGLTLALFMFFKKARMPGFLLRSRLFGKIAEQANIKLDEAFQILQYTFSQKDALFEAFSYGLVYSLLEILPFWVVAMAMGHPKLLLQIIIASGVGVTVGVFMPSPMGIGGFDIVMALFMGYSITNIESGAALASVITVTAHVLTVVGTAVTGIPFWLNGMRQISKES